jgi:acyl-CoA thioesterase
MDNQIDLSKKVVDRMFDNDPFSQWLGIERVEVGPGQCVLRMIVRDEMLNGFSIAHGGISYSLADSALAFASNGHGRMSVSVETSISHTLPVRSGDVLTATATELNRTDKIALYEVRVTNQDGKPVAFFKGTVYRTPKSWFPEDESN